jgi:hypothetical protein
MKIDKIAGAIGGAVLCILGGWGANDMSRQFNSQVDDQYLMDHHGARIELWIDGDVTQEKAQNMRNAVDELLEGITNTPYSDAHIFVGDEHTDPAKAPVTWRYRECGKYANTYGEFSPKQKPSGP